MKNKKIVEKKTGEKYASKKAMMKHEKSESKAEQVREYGKPKGPMQKVSPMKQIDRKLMNGSTADKKAIDKQKPPLAQVSKKTAYDIKEASNPKLTASARKNYADNAESAMKQLARHSVKKSPVRQEKLVKAAKATADLAVTGAKYLGKKAWEGIATLPL